LLAKFVLALAPASMVEIPDLVAVHIRGLVKERINVVMAKSLQTWLLRLWVLRPTLRRL
jgi:hypothetical protein